ncbi:MAG: SGNH/GDSL hydrolase family protein [Deltaproteobacteria bacterium]|nr:MAG: SGNH/GDSL hydrolase family protein [Deltaproteobacteria bacterium]
MKNWFERNPGKIFLVFLCLLLLGGVWITEKVLAWKADTYHSGIARVIRLREVQPLFSGRFAPTADEMRMSDTLVNKGYRVRTDADGLIEPSRIHGRADLSLVFLGGSTTACYYVDEEERFPYLSGRLLEQETGLKVNSYNSGVGGNFSIHSLDILLNKVMPMQPDLAVMMHNINDLTVLMFAKSYWDRDFKKGNTSPIVVLKKRYLDFRLLVEDYIPHFYNASKEFEKKVRRALRPKKAIKQEDELRDLRGKKIVIDKDRLLQEFNMNLELFINMCRARKITPVLMTMANRLKDNPDPLIIQLTQGLEKDHGITYRQYKEIFDLFNEAIRRTAAANGVLAIDLARAVPQEREYIYDLVHFTNRGSQLAAAVIEERLKPHLASLTAGRN